ncbi:hypothetical protein DICVIV_12392 [Dictyocaulus viviparus]|uniref:Uncharacterized protein n=1 Tax=Dictyocaulus viviparus TaxID=29172 RepID=A0A0D8XGZ1_DICVI|nr:hypothetical protein DICVIV_12392 [Dictyocaulus viviparus]
MNDEISTQLYEDICAGDLLGHIFWVTCYPEDYLAQFYNSSLDAFRHRKGQEYKCTTVESVVASDIEEQYRSLDRIEATKIEFGPQWYNDHLSEEYNWAGSQFNVKPNGKWPKEQLANVHKKELVKNLFSIASSSSRMRRHNFSSPEKFAQAEIQLNK